MRTNETKHTPGPWTVEHDGAGYPMIAGSEATDWGTEARYHWIANVLAVPEALHKGGKIRLTGMLMETEANARLIAAAPELLEALREFVSLMPSAEGLGGHAPIGAFQIVADLARAAIAKAEGR